VQISSTRIRDKSVILVPFLTALFIFVVARVYSMANALTNGAGNGSNLLIVFYVQIMPDDFVMQLHRF
jgi:hypothetical protein